VDSYWFPQSTGRSCNSPVPFVAPDVSFFNFFESVVDTPGLFGVNTGSSLVVEALGWLVIVFYLSRLSIFVSSGEFAPSGMNSLAFVVPGGKSFTACALR
jgi:hypothetical protein